MIGRCQPMNSCRPPSPAISSCAGVEEQVERVAEHHVVAERGDLGGLEALDGRLRRQRDERRRADLAVRGAQDAGARPRAGSRAVIVRTVVMRAPGHGRSPVVLASFLSVARDVGYPVLFVLIAIETMGIPVPGETALFTAGVLASSGHLRSSS